MFGLELYYGLIAHSASLLGDSAHNIGDALIILSNSNSSISNDE